MSNTRNIRVGLIGTGFMGKAHSLAYAAMPMFFWPAPAIPVRAVIASATEAGAAEAKDRFGFESSTTDWRRIVEDPTIEVVDISTPNNLHAEIAVAAAQAGKHILCEKPLARSASEAKSMLDAVEASGVVNMVAFNYRKIPAVALAKQYIDEGTVGRVLNFRACYLQDWSADPQSPLSWRFQKATAGAGAVGDLGTHVVDLARFLVGEISAVTGLAHTIVPGRPSQPAGREALGASKTGGDMQPVDVDDEMITLLKFSEGAIGSLEVTRNAYGRHNFLTFEIHGSKGSIHFEYDRRDQLQLFLADDPPDRRGFRSVHTGPAHPYGGGLWPIPALGIGYSEIKIVEAYDLMKSIVEGVPASPNFYDGWRACVVADAILESSASGRWVDIPA